MPQLTSNNMCHQNKHTIEILLLKTPSKILFLVMFAVKRIIDVLAQNVSVESRELYSVASSCGLLQSGPSLSD